MLGSFPSVLLPQVGSWTHEMTGEIGASGRVVETDYSAHRENNSNSSIMLGSFQHICTLPTPKRPQKRELSLAYNVQSNARTIIPA